MGNRKRALQLRSALFAAWSRTGGVLLLCLLLLLLVGFPMGREQAFRVTLVREGEVALLHPVRTGDMIAHTYVHSVEQCPITETFKVAGRKLQLMQVRNCSYGAGIAHTADKGSGSLHEGMYVIDNIREPHDRIYMQPAGFTRHTLSISRADSGEEQVVELSALYPDQLLLLEVVAVPAWKLRKLPGKPIR